MSPWLSVALAYSPFPLPSPSNRTSTAVPRRFVICAHHQLRNTYLSPKEEHQSYRAALPGHSILQGQPCPVAAAVYRLTLETIHKTFCPCEEEKCIKPNAMAYSFLWLIGYDRIWPCMIIWDVPRCVCVLPVQASASSAVTPASQSVPSLHAARGPAASLRVKIPIQYFRVCRLKVAAADRCFWSTH